MLLRVRELIAKHKNRSEEDLLVLKEEDSSFEHVCRDLSIDAAGFGVKLTRVATLTEQGAVTYDILRPSGRPLAISSSKKLAVFKSGALTNAMFPSSDEMDTDEYPFAGYKFTLANPKALKSLVRKAFDNGIPMEGIFHRSSELFDFCKGLKADVDDTESSSVSVFGFREV